MPTSPWGDHRLGFGEPLAEELQQLRVSGGMGNIELAQLGNARARELRISSRMGNFTVDLGGEWPTDDVSDLEVTHSMGDLRLRIPNSVRVTPDSRSSAKMGESGRIERRDETADPAAPVLRLDLSTTMGALASSGMTPTCPRSSRRIRRARAPSRLAEALLVCPPRLDQASWVAQLACPEAPAGVALRVRNCHEIVM